MLTGLLTTVAPVSAAAATCGGWTRYRVPDASTGWNLLEAVTVTSRRNAWATSQYQGGSRILHWNGSAWRFQRAPIGFQDQVFGLAATSAASAWTVGSDYKPSTSQGLNLILHWNGSTWKRQPSPHPGIGSVLSAVAATSASSAWAVGYYVNGTPSSHTQILHWNGRSWQRQPAPNPGTLDRLYGVAATSASSAWAVGYAITSRGFQTVILHWNGSTWKRQPSPSPSPAVNTALLRVAAISPSNAWAVGSYYDYTTGQTLSLILHWNGSSWSRQPSPAGELQSVAAISASNAWAVGEYTNSQNQLQALTLHWNGHAWKRQPSPNPVAAGYNQLNGVAASSAANAWAVGRSGDRNFAAHYC